VAVSTPFFLLLPLSTLMDTSERLNEEKRDRFDLGASVTGTGSDTDGEVAVVLVHFLGSAMTRAEIFLTSDFSVLLSVGSLGSGFVAGVVKVVNVGSFGFQMARLANSAALDFNDLD